MLELVPVARVDRLARQHHAARGLTSAAAKVLIAILSTFMAR